jgi:hypothetical protein
MGQGQENWRLRLAMHCAVLGARFSAYGLGLIGTVFA